MIKPLLSSVLQTLPHANQFRPRQEQQHFSPVLNQHVLNSTLNKMLLDMHYKN